MNIDTFEKTHPSQESLAHDDVLTIKQKIESRKSKQKRSKVILGSLIGTILVLIVVVGYSQYKLYLLSQEELVVEKETAVTAATSTPKTPEDIVKALSRHILVPEGIPQVAAVEDAAKLRDTQAFFKNTENGDVVVVYDTTIFIYRPSVDIVVASGDISGQGQVKP